jgi:hypothetical protein
MSNSGFDVVFAALKEVLARHSGRLSVKANTSREYTLVTRTPSPFPQHKGEPMFFGSVKAGKAYVSFHLMPLYMCATLTDGISSALKKRMQGKTCFNFKTVPDRDLLEELEKLTASGLALWAKQKWL